MPCKSLRDHIHLPQNLESTLSLHFNNTRHPLQAHFIACKKSILCLFSKSGSSREVPITVSLSLLLWQAEGTQKSSGTGGWFLAMCSAGGECGWKIPGSMWSCGCCMFTVGTRAAGTLLPSAGYCLGCPTVWQCSWGHGFNVQHLVGCHDMPKYSAKQECLPQEFELRSTNLSTFSSQEFLWIENLVGNI